MGCCCSRNKSDDDEPGTVTELSTLPSTSQSSGPIRPSFPSIRRRRQLQKSEPLKVDVTEQAREAMQRIFDATRVHTEAGKGYDAVGLQHTHLKVKKVYQLRNPTLLDKYLKRVRDYQEVAPKLKGGRYLPLERTAQDVLSQDKVLTTKVSSNNLGDFPCDPKLNEVYLFHGTKNDYVDSIVNAGFDLQRAGMGLYGKALYFAESAHKSDQYADYHGNRRSEDLSMFVVRVILGRSYVNEHSMKINADNIPCLKRGCMKPGCTEHPYFFDSVVSGKNPNGQLARYREFTLHDADRCLPQFLIVYDRVMPNDTDS